MTHYIKLLLLFDPTELLRCARHPSLRVLKSGRGRTEHRTERYFDTPDFALQSAGMALHVFGTNRGWIQTLTIGNARGGGLHSWQQWVWPVTTDAPSWAELSDTPAYKALRGKSGFPSLAPVFEIDLTCTTYALRFENGTEGKLSLDRGEIRAGKRKAPIGEAEIALDHGKSPGCVFDLAIALAETLSLRVGFASKAERGYALAARQPPSPRKATGVQLRKNMTRDDAFRAIVDGCMWHLQVNEPGMLANRDPEYLHQMRVAMRRMRSAFSVFGEGLAPDAILPVIPKARRLGQCLGAARNWDVFCAETLRSLSKSFLGDAGVTLLVRRAARLRGIHGRVAREAVGCASYARFLLRLGHIMVGDTTFIGDRNEPIREFAARVLQKRHRRVRQLGERLAQLSPEELHNFRIRAKKLRYCAEFFVSLFPGLRARKYVHALSQLQDILGTLNDAATAEILLRDLASRGIDRSDGTATGIVRGWIAAERHRQVTRLSGAWATFIEQPRFWKRSLPGPSDEIPIVDEPPVVPPEE